jgi:uncharacterized repeat protein (TIGR01451 family)
VAQVHVLTRKCRSRCYSLSTLDRVVAAGGTDLVVAKSHSGNFTVGVNGIYTIAVSNIGGTASSGVITVSDLLNPNACFGCSGGRDFQFVSVMGTGWSCSTQHGFPSDWILVTCSSTTVIVAGGSSTPITLTVIPNMSGTVTNTVSVSGGGDTVLSNNTADDVTVVAAAVPTLPQWALIALTGLLAVAGFIALRRQTTLQS